MVELSQLRVGSQLKERSQISQLSREVTYYCLYMPSTERVQQTNTAPCCPSRLASRDRIWLIRLSESLAGSFFEHRTCLTSCLDWRIRFDAAKVKDAGRALSFWEENFETYVPLAMSTGPHF